MNSTDKSITIVIVLSVIIIIVSILQNQKEGNSLASPNLIEVIAQKINPSPSSSSSPRLKTFKFDSSTDLKKELDSVNPQVLDSDFNE